MSERDRRINRIAYWVAVVGFVGASIVTAFFWAADYSSANQYDQSPICLFSIVGPCPAAETTEKTATVVDIGQTGGKSTRYWVDLSGLAPDRKHVEFTDGGGVWPLLHDGDEVTVIVWRGLITGVQNDKASSQAWDNPDFTAYNQYLMLLYFVFPALALTIGPAVNRTKRMRHKGWFVSTWIMFAGVLYAMFLIIVRELNFTFLPVSFAIVGLIMYPTVVVIGTRRLRKKAVSDARPARVP